PLLLLVSARTARSALFPYTTLFRSRRAHRRAGPVPPRLLRGAHRGPPRRLADRARPTAPARVHRRRVARAAHPAVGDRGGGDARDRKSTRLNSSHLVISYAVFCLKK